MAELKERTYLRSIALQILYEYEMSSHQIGDIIKNRFEVLDLSDEGEKFVFDLVSGVYKNQREIDEMISKYAPEWPIDKIAAVDCNIIRIAAYEFAISGMTPEKVAINEAIELAKTFGSETAPKFVNGVLGAISDNLATS